MKQMESANTAMADNPPFWETTPLHLMDRQQWESLCDGCGKCCLLKLEDVDTGDIHYTDVGCRLLDQQNCRCTDYENRKSLVPDCIILKPQNLDTLPWMPETCSYRLLHEGKTLPDWHPLVSGKMDSTISSGNSVSGQIISEDDVAEQDLPDHIKKW